MRVLAKAKLGMVEQSSEYFGVGMQVRTLGCHVAYMSAATCVVLERCSFRSGRRSRKIFTASINGVGRASPWDRQRRRQTKHLGPRSKRRQLTGARATALSKERPRSLQ